MTIYRSGDTVGEQVREPGRGSNPMPTESSSPTPTTGAGNEQNPQTAPKPGGRAATAPKPADSSRAHGPATKLGKKISHAAHPTAVPAAAVSSMPLSDAQLAQIGRTPARLLYPGLGAAAVAIAGLRRIEHTEVEPDDLQETMKAVDATSLTSKARLVRKLRRLLKFGG